MFFDRLITLVKSNLNDSEMNSQEALNIHNSQRKDQKPTVDTSMNATELKEAQYLANLELKPKASFEEIKAAYKKLMKQYHPDKFYGNELQLHAAVLVTAKLNEAYSYFEKKYSK